MEEQIQYEPKRKNRFSITFPNGYNIEPWMIIRADKPKYNMFGWETMEIVFTDTIGVSVTQSLYKLIGKDSDLPLNTSIKYEMLDPTGVVVEEWIITGEISYIDFGTLNYAHDFNVEPRILIKPTSCVLTF